MIIVDWRQVDPRALTLVFARERVRWLIDLGWDTREAWIQVEKARTGWGLPGLAAIDESGRVRGLAFFHENGKRFDLGGVFAESAVIRQSLLDAVIEVCEDTDGEEVTAFVYEGSSPSRDQLTERGFVLEPFDYLVAALLPPETSVSGDESYGGRAFRPGGPGGPGEPSLRDWQKDDVNALAALLSASYGSSEAQPFVQDVSTDGWRDYVTKLVQHAACGALVPEATTLAVDGDRVVGAVLVTHLGPSTSHIAQLAVHPECRRRGVGRALLDRATAVAANLEYSRMTLLVSASNSAAQTLYRSRGFVRSAAFLSATKALRAKAERKAS